MVELDIRDDKLLDIVSPDTTLEQHSDRLQIHRRTHLASTGTAPALQ